MIAEHSAVGVLVVGAAIAGRKASEKALDLVRTRRHSVLFDARAKGFQLGIDIAEIKRKAVQRIEDAIVAVDKAGKPGRKFYEEYTK